MVIRDPYDLSVVCALVGRRKRVSSMQEVGSSLCPGRSGRGTPGPYLTIMARLFPQELGEGVGRWQVGDLQGGDVHTSRVVADPN